MTEITVKSNNVSGCNFLGELLQLILSRILPIP